MKTSPRAERRPRRATHHGVELVDDYAWLRADAWQEVMRDPARLPADIRAHLDAENAYTAAMMTDTDALQVKLFDEMKARIKQDDSSVPNPDGPFAYYSSFVTGGEYRRICRQPREGGADEVLLDGNVLAAGAKFFDLSGADHSHDHKLMAYGVDDKGSELYTVKVRDLAAGGDLPDAIPDTRGGTVWALDNRTLFYVRVDDNHRPYAIYRHRLGTAVADDVLVYQESDPGFFVGIGATKSRRYILVSTHDHETSEVYLLDAEMPDGSLRLVSARRREHQYSIDHAGGRFVILTNSDGAEDFRICAADETAPEEAHWRQIEPHKSGRLILGVTPLARHIVRLEREAGLPRIVIRRRADNAEHEIAFPEEAYSLGLLDGFEADTNRIRFSYSSMTTPAEVYDYDVESRARTLRKRQEVPSGHDPADYVTRRVQAPTTDGERVPVSLLYRKDTALDGSAPLLLYGYGSYGISIPAGFSTDRLSLVDRGFVYALAHVRGGKDKGYRWYTSGKREQKINTFKDYIAAGEFLAAAGFTTPGRIVGHGGSAGGLLMGAVANMAPDLFLGLVAEVPFVDALNTVLDASLPLTPPEWPEWGNPIVSRADFDTIRSYSPYDNVVAKAYPHILATGGLTDPRVTYWEPAKWVAKLRAKKTNDKLLLMKINMGAGHGGASGRFERLKETALAYAFALKIAGKTGGMA